MNSKRGLMTMLVGLAMLATPMAANAKDWHWRNGRQAVFARPNFRNGAAWTPPPPAIDRHDWHEQHEWLEHHRGWNGGYYPAPVYAAPVYAAPVYQGYGGYGGYGGGAGCGGAQRVMRTYARDRATGHPAAAADLLRQNQWAMHSGCGAGAPFGRGWFGGGQGGYRGAPYNNYGYGQPYGGGSMLAPLFQQYIH